MEWYNGFSPNERNANATALKAALEAGDVARPAGRCALCGDTDAALEYHSEDYSKPYRWSEPAAYVLCRHCHRDKLHKRFKRPDLWEAFKAHVRRGGYASDLKKPDVKKEFETYRHAVREGRILVLRPLRPYSASPGSEWWQRLTTDPATMAAPRLATPER